jgi:hypothetical protein
MEAALLGAQWLPGQFTNVPLGTSRAHPSEAKRHLFGFEEGSCFGSRTRTVNSPKEHLLCRSHGSGESESVSKCRNNRLGDQKLQYPSLAGPKHGRQPMQRNSTRPAKLKLHLPRAMGRDRVKEKQEDIELAVLENAPSRSTRSNTEIEIDDTESEPLTTSNDGTEKKAGAGSAYARLWSNVNAGTMKHEPGSLIGAILLVAGTTVRILRPMELHAISFDPHTLSLQMLVLEIRDDPLYRVTLHAEKECGNKLR